MYKYVYNLYITYVVFPCTFTRTYICIQCVCAYSYEYICECIHVYMHIHITPISHGTKGVTRTRRTHTHTHTHTQTHIFTGCIDFDLFYFNQNVETRPHNLEDFL